jgi:UDP-galactopyranose mutase
MLAVDYLVVGSGLTGATIARLLADARQEVLVIERRSHVGGNVHDQVHPSGIRIHTYGPHYFRTSSDRIWEFVTRFSKFYKYEASLKSLIDGQYESWPVSASYIQRFVGDKWEPEFKGIPTNFEEAALSMMPRLVYDKFVKGYTEKQWGMPAYTLSADLVKRFRIQQDKEQRLSSHKYQGLPLYGYHMFMQTMLEGIPIILNVDHLKCRDSIRPNKLLIFTGPIDEFFNYDLGRLKYRGQQREHTYLSDLDFYQPCGQVNNPDPANASHIRTLEWKHMMISEQVEQIKGTVITREVPVTPNDSNHFEYPFPDEANRLLYQRYRDRAKEIPNLLICGRLGEYRYYDMDQAIGRAMMLFERISNEWC